MRHKLLLTCLRTTLALCLSLGSTAALAATVWYVDGMNGDDLNTCKSASAACATIGHTISLASSGDTIMIAPATYPENLIITKSLKLIGSGATTTIIGGGGLRVVAILSTTTIVSLSKVTIQKGVSAGGGGILNWGTLTLTNSILSGNTVGSESSAVGGGIENLGRLTITNSTLSGNSGTGNSMYGGAIYNAGTLTITNSTLSGNSAFGRLGGGGGGIYNGSGGSVTIINTTLSGNSAPASGGGGIYNGSGSVAINNATLSGNTAAAYKGGGIFVATGATVTLQNSIVANSSTAGNCYGTLSTLISHGYNLSDDNTCSHYFHISGDRNNPIGGARLGPLQNNTGPTFTHALLSGSPAIDKGNPSGCTDGKGHLLTTDQRGRPRPDKDDALEIPKPGCDMGAYESQTY